MTESESTLNRQRWRLIEWPLMWSLAGVAFGLGLVGFAKLPDEPPLTSADMIYNTLQLFVLNNSFSGPLNWQLEVARFLAPGVMAYTATQALIVLFREQLMQLRLRFTRGHVVVCGLGRTGFKVTADCLRRGEKVVIIEEDTESDWIGMSEDLGATVLIGDATDAQLLHQARIQHARLLVAVCGNDGINVEVAIRAYELKRASPSGTGPTLGCHVHIVESDLRALFKEHRVFTDTGDRFRVVIGFGLMGESLVLQAARNSHFANGKRLRVTVVDRDPAPQQRCFLRRYPRLDTVCDVAFLAREADDAETLAEIATMVAEPGTLPTVAICFDDDTRSLSLALALLPKLKPLRVPLLLRMTTDGGLTTLLDSDMATTRLAGLVKPFPIIGRSTESEALIHREMDAGAMAIHEDYVIKRRQGKHDAKDPALCPWELLDEDLKDSNRQQADHIAVKLRAIGLTTVADSTGTPVTAFTAEEVETLARMEHARWNAERFLAGWSHAPGEKDIEHKTSPRLIGWDALPEDIRDYDREAVRNIPHVVQMSGRRVVRKAAF